MVEKLEVKESNVEKKKSPQKRLVGKDKNTGRNMYAYVGKFGPVLQIGDSDTSFVSIKENYDVATITEDEANTLTQYPKVLGKYDGKDIILKDGKFGLYLSYNGKNYGIKEGDKDSIANITLDEASEIVKEKDDKLIKIISKTCKIMNGPYGPFILCNGKIASVPREIEDPKKLTYKECREIVANKKEFKKK
jgi:DNA topoisomerase-1